MPILNLFTNVPAEAVPSDFAAKTVDVVASALGKPKSYVVVNVAAGQNMNFGGTSAPCAIANLGSIGAINPSANKNTSALISNHLEKTLGIAPDRFYLTFEDLKPANIGFNGTTFADILG